jgi:hypothetical protein
MNQKGLFIFWCLDVVVCLIAQIVMYNTPMENTGIICSIFLCFALYMDSKEGKK